MRSSLWGRKWWDLSQWVETEAGSALLRSCSGSLLQGVQRTLHSLDSAIFLDQGTASQRSSGEKAEGLPSTTSQLPIPRVAPFTADNAG